MAQWIRWWGLAVFAAVIVLWWLCIDSIIKATIETVGTELMGAKVELTSARLQLAPSRLTLTGLQVTDPKAPMQNLLVADRIEAAVDAMYLFERKLVADEMSVSGLQFNTERQTSGAIEGRLLSETGVFNSDNLNIAGAIPGLSLPDVDQLVEQEKAKLSKQFQQIETDLKQLETKWEKRLDQLPDKEKITNYKKRINDVKKGNLFEKLAGFKSIKEDIDKDRDALKGLGDELKRDIDYVEAQIRRAADLPKQQINQLLADLGLGDNALDSLAGGVMSGQVKQWIQQALSFVKSSGDDASASTPVETVSRDRGIWIQFTEQQPVPQLLIRKASLDGRLSLAGQDIRFSGQAADLTHQPEKWHKPATITVTGESGQQTHVQVNALLDHRTQPGKDHMEFGLERLPLSNYSLSDKPELKVLATSALTSAQGSLQVVGDKLELDVLGQFRDVELAVSTDKSNALTTAIIDALHSVMQFDLRLQLNGPFTNPDITVRSDLDNLLANAVRQSVKKQTVQYKAELTDKLNAQMATQLRALKQRGEYFTGAAEKLRQKESELKVLTKSVKG